MSEINRKQKDLYYKGGNKDKKINLKKAKFEYSDNWNDSEISKVKSIGKYIPYFRLLIFSILVFIVSATISISAIFFGFDKSISADKIDIDIHSPANVDSGETLDFSVTVINKNPVPMTLTDLVISYPDGVRDSKTGETLIRTRKGLGPIGVNSSTRHSVKPILFGKTGERKDIDVTIEYRLEGSQALFSLSESKTILIRSAPITLTISGIDTTVSGKETEFLLNIFSNSRDVIDEVLIQKQYPVRFIQASSSIEEIEGGGWEILNLEPNERRQLKVRGTLVGANRDEQTLTFDAYIGDDTKIASISKMIIIESPPIDVKLTLNSFEGDLINITGQDVITGRLSWENISDTKFQDVVVKVKFSGDGLDRSGISVSAGGGFDINTNEIIWNPITTQELKLVNPGDRGSYQFGFRGLEGDPLLNLENKQIMIDVDLALSSAGSQVRIQNIKNIVNKVIKIRSDVVLLGSTKHSTSKIVNTGPIPPKVGEETTYSLSFILTNNGNKLTNVRTEIPLKDSVEWIGSVVPSNTDIMYDASSKVATWNIESIGASGTNSSTEIQFKVSVIPRLSDVGRNIDLTGKIKFAFTDSFTGEEMSIELDPLSTSLLGETSNIRSGYVVR